MRRIRDGWCRGFLTIALVIILIMSLAACGDKPSGTYRSRGIISQTYTFNGDNITMSAFGIDATGTYKISGNTITIKYILLGTEQTISQSYSKDGKSIFIGGTELIKK